MLRPFTAVALPDSQLPQALPLIRATWPDVDLETWRSFARSFPRRRPDRAPAVVGLFDTTGGLCGIFIGRPDRQLRHGMVFSLPLFTALDLANSLDPVRALLDAAQARARLHGCTDLHIFLWRGQSDLANHLNRLGLPRPTILYSMEIGMSSSVI